MKKRFVSMLLALAMCMGRAVPGFAAEAESVIEPLEYNDVVEHISSENMQIVEVSEFNIKYYFGENITVVDDDGDFYLISKINDDGEIHFSVNGYQIPEVVYDTCNSNYDEPSRKIASSGYPTKWNTTYDIDKTFNVGGMPTSVIGGLIGSAIGFKISPTLASVIVSAVVGAAAGIVLDGLFPVDYKLNVTYFEEMRILTLGPPAVVEYHEIIGVYAGPTANVQENTLYYKDRTYEDVRYE